MFVTIPKVPRWAQMAASNHAHPIAELATQGLALVELLGGAFAAMAVGAAVIGVLSGGRARRNDPEA
jgi:hypothetical protein